MMLKEIISPNILCCKLVDADNNGVKEFAIGTAGNRIFIYCIKKDEETEEYSFVQIKWYKAKFKFFFLQTFIQRLNRFLFLHNP